MKRKSVLESLETVLVVSVITALIWLYAEGETIRTDTREIKVLIVPPTPDLFLSAPDQESTDAGEIAIKVKATVQASRSEWPRITEWIRRETVNIEVSPPSTESEEQPINLREELNASALADINALVTDVAPSSLTVTVEQLREVEMPVVINRGELELSDEAPPTVNPERVTVSMTADAARLVREQNLALTARLDEIDPNALQEDTQQNPSVRLDLPPELRGRPFVRLPQDRVNVAFIVRKLTDEIVLPSVPVLLRHSDLLSGRYDFDIDPENQRILRVTLRGPSEAIRRIEADPSLVHASILIRISDLENQDNLAAPLEFFLPKGVKVVAKEPDLNTVTYTATPLAEQP